MTRAPGIPTPRQIQVLRMLADGMTTFDIAADLWLSIETVRYHIRGAYRALGVHNRRDAIAVLATYEPRCPACGRVTAS